MAVLSCHLCGLPAEGPVAVAAEGHAFCCHGCRELWRLIGPEGLDKLRSGPGVDWQALRAGLAAPADAADSPLSGDTRTVRLALGGLWCASCAVLIEQVVGRRRGVLGVRVDYATASAEVAFDTGALSAADVQDTIGRLGYTAREPAAGDAAAAEPDLLRRFGAAALLATVVMMASVPVWTGDYPLLPPGLHAALGYGLWVLATPVVFWAGWPFLRGAWVSLGSRVPTMDLLIAAGSLAAYGYSAAAVVGGGPLLYFDTASMLVAFLLLGRCLEVAARNRAAAVVRLLAGLAAKDACVLRDGSEIQVPLAEVAPGDVVVVRPGQRVPVDGVVVAGSSSVDEALLTGESLPVDKAAGDTAYAGTMNRNGRLLLRASRIGAETVLGQTVRAVQAAQARKGLWQRRADRLVHAFVPFVLFVAGGVFAWGLWVADLGGAAALLRAVAVLVIACPCALGVATPLAVLAGSQRAGRRGLLLRSGDALERAAAVGTVLFDKTGTLTAGRMSLAGMWPVDEGLLALAASVELASEHPLALALVGAARERGLTFAPVEDFREEPGAGVRGRVAGRLVEVGSPGLAWGVAGGGVSGDGVAGAGVPGDRAAGGGVAGGGVAGGGVPGDRAAGGGVAGRGVPGRDVPGGGAPVAPGPAGGTPPDPGGLQEAVADWERDGWTALVLRVDGAARAAFALSDRHRPEAAAVVAELRAAGLEVALVTGDSAGTAAAVAAAVGVEVWHARHKPADKAAIVADLQRDGRVVAFVGDGVNDAAALVQADLGLALATGADIAVEAGQVTLVRPDLRAVPDLLAIARETVRVIRQNLAWALAYNLLALPAAAAGLAHPVLAAGAMVCSSAFVLANSLRLLGWSPSRWVRGVATVLACGTLLAALAWWGV